MRIKDVLYNKYYPLTVINRLRIRKKNKNQKFSLLCGNCVGGYIYHQLGVKFQSPTINLMMLQPDFYKLCLNLEEYLKQEIIDVSKENGVVQGKLKDLTIYFTHYKSFEDAVEKWYSRSRRVDFENLYIIASDRDGIKEEQIRELGKAQCKKLLIFTANKYKFPYCFQVKEFENEKEIGNILHKRFSGKWYFEEIFDYVGWLNSDDYVAEHFRIK